MIRTVLKDIEGKDLGITYAHDHLVVRKAEYNNLEPRILLDDIERTEGEVSEFKRAGGRSIVDVQPFGAGRDIEALKKISMKTGINIIAATGLHKREFYSKEFWSEGADYNEIAELFIHEIQIGAYGFNFKDPFSSRSNIKAGIIKVATDENGLTNYYRKIFKAAAAAHKQTGVPIITHTELSTFGIEQAEFLINNGVDPDKIIISHMDKMINLNNITKLAQMGVFLEFDCIARFKYHSNEDEIALIKQMIENGFEDQILFGMDSTRERFLSYGGRYGLAYIIEEFVPMMRRMEIKDVHIEKILINNPAIALRFN